MSKRGRKSKYESHVMPFLDKIPHWRRDGMTEQEIADKLGVDYSTLKTYKNLFPAFSAVLKNGKQELIENLKDTLFKRAIGYEFEELKTYIEKDELGREKKKVEKIKKIIQSDTCLVFSLKNLDPENWKDRKELKQDINATVQNLTIDIVDDEDNVIDPDGIDLDED